MAENFGYETKGGLSSSPVNTICASKYGCPEAGEGKSITVYADSFTGVANIKCAIYKADLTLLAVTEEKALQPVGWTTFNFITPPELEAADYILCVWAGGAVGGNVYRDADAGVDRWWQSLAYGAWPDPIGASDRTGKYSIYCTYEVVVGWTGKISGVVNPAKIMGVDVANIAKVKGVE